MEPKEGHPTKFRGAAVQMLPEEVSRRGREAEVGWVRWPLRRPPGL